ncbi:MAG: transcriptional regulator, TetR family [Frankiales bacterium]|jgi:AcrR family transcriptional regulator|nr:transcriptional regulator, TetR family [Frankiales bacterium]
MEATSSTPKRRGPPRSLREDDLLDAALSLVDEGGPEAASVRGIAARVGVAPNAVYTYFRDRSAVIRALVDRLLGGVDHDVFADRSQPWRARVESLALELRRQLATHPGVVPLVIASPLDGPQALTLHERLLEVFADAGLDDVAAARASYLLVTYMLGSVALDVAGALKPGPLPPEPARVAARHSAFAAASADRFPRASAAAATVAAYVSTEQYLWGLRRLLDGVDPESEDAPSAGAEPNGRIATGHGSTCPRSS